MPPFVPAAERADWITHPANLWGLVENPLRPLNAGDPPPHALGRWDPATRRGWNGPYIGLDAATLCMVPRVAAGWIGGPQGRSRWELGGPIALLPAPVVAVTDPFEGAPLDEPARWSTYTATDGAVIVAFTCFTRSYDPDHPLASVFSRQGMPYLVFDRDETPTAPTQPSGLLRARLVSMGPDRSYGGACTDPRFTLPFNAQTDLTIASDPSLIDGQPTCDDLARFVHR